MNPQVSRHLFNNSRPVTRGKEPDKSLRIELTIRNEATGFSSTYKVSDAKELRAVFRIFCKAQSPDNPAFGRYAFYYGDQIVTEDNCPYDLQMNDGDVIDAVPRMFAEMV
mmetsp:Transcript_13510/g.11525  ORF Transcript_13510/g.11525 Transcript_13510/m.11525 type:complete len:110 (+) Transcript_13510:18-347(+)